MNRVHIGLTRDFERLSAEGQARGFAWMDQRHDVTWSWLPEHGSTIEAAHVDGFDAVISLGPSWGPRSFPDAGRLLLIARWGVGLDHVDVTACTDADVLVTTTRHAVRRPMAVANVTMILAVAGDLRRKDLDVRAGRWMSPGLSDLPMGLQGRTLGSIGLGSIALETFRLMRPFGMNHLAYSPTTSQVTADEQHIESVSLPDLLSRSDVVMVNCPLTPATHGLLDAKALSALKPGAVLVNLARGPIIDEEALIDALDDGPLRRAGLDVFSTEPLPDGNRLADRDDVLLTPHSLGITDQMCSAMAVEHEQVLARLLAGREPEAVANPAVLERPGFRAKHARLMERTSR